MRCRVLDILRFPHASRAVRRIARFPRFDKRFEHRRNREMNDGAAHARLQRCGSMNNGGMTVLSIPYREPAAAFMAFAEDRHAALLGGSGGLAGDCVSLVAANPVEVIEAVPPGRQAGHDPFEALEEVWQRHRRSGNGLPFIGALIGYLGYELGGYLEKLPPPKSDYIRVPAMSFAAYDTAALFDRRRRTAAVIGPDEAKAARFAARLTAAPMELPPPAPVPSLTWRAEQSREEAEAGIARIIDYICAGDVYQVNYTQRFVARRPAGLSDFDLFRRLAAISPAPYSAFLRCGDVSILSASPERFVALDGEGLVTAEPIKGTRRRDGDPARDARLARELQESVKDNAENLMIVDLMRNDLSRICEPHSVDVPHLNRLQSFSHVHHLVSTVTGRLQAGASPIDVLRATFPGGSITGAPKIRAMEIIRELEPFPRGAYCGAYGWIGFDGRADLAMTIRTLTVTPEWVMAQAGGGIVADSTPVAEYEESLVKVAPLLRAGLGEAEDEDLAERQAMR
jgi:para-aminobenzoate synthetase component I